MAIKVNGTTVIDDSRNLSNVGGLKTINSTSILGSGNISAGASTTYGAVGTYVFANRYASGGFVEGSTYSGSSLYPAGLAQAYPAGADDLVGVSHTYGGSALSGTWRAMGRSNYSSSDTDHRMTVFVRIS